MPGKLIICRVGAPVSADIRLQITRSRRGLAEGWMRYCHRSLVAELVWSLKVPR